jgi:hypothetical protein
LISLDSNHSTAEQVAHTGAELASRTYARQKKHQELLRMETFQHLMRFSKLSDVGLQNLEVRSQYDKT